MGANMAIDLANGAGIGISRTDGLRIHLTSNHFPPVHEVFVETAIQAIDLANSGDWSTELTMPNGLVRTVQFIVDGLHLHAWIQDSE